jgi:hypothetical protein
MSRMRVGFTIGLVAILWGVGVKAGGGGSFGLYVDVQGTNCNIVDTEPGLLSIALVHTTPDGATASRFAAPIPACMTGAVWISDTAAYEVIGNSQTGVVVPYGSCQTGRAHILTINMIVEGTSETCCYYPVLPDPNVGSGRIEVLDCSETIVFGIGEFSVVNGDISCPCGGPVPVEETTWGSVKALYRE